MANASKQVEVVKSDEIVVYSHLDNTQKVGMIILQDGVAHAFDLSDVEVFTGCFLTACWTLQGR